MILCLISIGNWRKKNERENLMNDINKILVK